FQTYYCLFSLLTWHPIVLYLLIREPGHISKEIRFGYIVNQIGLMVNEWIFCVLIRVYPLMPYPALHCGGFLCGIGIPHWILLTILAFGVILPNPPFEYLLLVMHQKLVLNTASTVRVSKRSQNVMITALLLLLLVNIAGFGIFGIQTAKADGILNRPELVWLTSKGGEVFIFGDVGEPGNFAYECYILGAVLVIVFPVVVFLSIHAVYIMMLMKKNVTDNTMQSQLRLIKVLLLQLGSVFQFYIIPLGIMITTIMFGTLAMPDWVLGSGRPLYTMIFILNPMPQSLIFILRNPTYRRIIWDKVRSVFYSIFPCAIQTVPTLHLPNAFSHLPSSSMTRPSAVS
ncbi:hypothetical protein PENTCL1PPCAC_16770, partial [Pristionchus entomophagus]